MAHRRVDAVTAAPFERWMPELPTRCLHGPRCQIMRTELESFECATLVPNVLAPMRARHLVRLVTAAWDLLQLEGPAVGAASELVTNALRYGRLVVRVDLRVYIEHRQLVFEVEDRSPRPPEVKPLPAARRSGSGFGLQVVADTADDWGYEYFTPDHKRVWAAFDLPATQQRTTGGSGTMTDAQPPKAMYPGDRRAWTLTGEPGCSPTLADVRGWCRGTITGPWGLPVETAHAADQALTGMMPDRLRLADPVTVRLLRMLAGAASVVTVLVDEEMVRLPPVSAVSHTTPLIKV